MKEPNIQRHRGESIRSMVVSAITIGLLVLSSEALGQTTIALNIRRNGAELEVVWPAGLQQVDQTLVYPSYDIQRSENLQDWELVGQGLRQNGAALGALLRYAFTTDRPQGFFRVMGRLQTFAATSAGAEVFGYGDAFADELAKLGQLTAEDFAALYPAGADYLPQVTFDPTTAEHWDLFESTPEFRLSAAEEAIFRRNGFVVSERLGSPSFGHAFRLIWTKDLPVYFSSDAALHAWHRSYIALLQEMELVYLLKTFQDILDGMAAEVPAVWEQHGQTQLSEGILDADYYLAVARSLLHRRPVASQLGQDERVADTLAAVQDEALQEFILFGRPRTVDFSQFKVRGHYEEFPSLHGYFQGMMWCGRIDLRIAGNSEESSLRELAGAVILNQLMQASGRFELWQNFDRILQTFVGWTDSMTFGQLSDLLTAGGIASLGDLPDETALEAFQAAIESSEIGVQNIRSHYFASPLGTNQIELPRSFTVMGQKFVPDSWALSKVVFDDILWDSKKVQRRVPSALDVAFSVLKNNHIVPLLVDRINATDGHRWRDGWFYQHNLAAVRNVIDRQTPESWTDNIYLNWLACLRELSEPTTDATYPEVMRTQAWAMKNLNTQLASWSQLRHDTILYAKQSYTEAEGCDYPDGYVEPLPAFWAQLGNMATRTAELLAELPVQGVTQVSERNSENTQAIDLQVWKNGQQQFLERFAVTMDTLRQLAEKELANTPFTEEEAHFLQGLISSQDGRAGCGGVLLYDGWYPGLFYRSNEGLDLLRLGEDDVVKWDAIVADVHTDVPFLEIGDPGSVLHQGVGNVNLMVVAIDCPEGSAVYAGPVLSHYEFEMPGIRRKSDSEWKDDHANQLIPAPPEWTREYLVPQSVQ